MTKTSQAYHLVNILDHYSWSHLSGQPRTQGLDQDPGYQVVFPRMFSHMKLFQTRVFPQLISQLQIFTQYLWSLSRRASEKLASMHGDNKKVVI